MERESCQDIASEIQSRFSVASALSPRKGEIYGNFPGPPTGAREATILKACTKQAEAPGRCGEVGFPVLLCAPSPEAGLSGS